MSSAKDNVTWLHLSDLHLCEKKTGFNAKKILDDLLKDLKVMQVEFKLHPDFIFFTGDIAYGNLPESPIKDQYQEAEGFFERLRTAFTPAVKIDRIFLIPGNHDVNRGKVAPSETLYLDSLLDKRSEEALETVDNHMRDNTEQWQRFLLRLSDYRTFLEKVNYRHLLTHPSHLIYAVVVRVAKKKIGIAGLNSSWACCREIEYGKLWMGSWQVAEVARKLDQAAFTIALTHHPFSWMGPPENPDLSRTVEAQFQFHLHGHEHELWVTQGDRHVRIAAGACYARSTMRKEGGYNFVRLFPNEARGEVYLRRYEEKGGGGWVPCVIPGGKTDANGCWPLTNLSWLEPSRRTPGAEAGAVAPRAEATLQSTHNRDSSPESRQLVPEKTIDYFRFGRKDTDSRFDELLFKARITAGGDYCGKYRRKGMCRKVKGSVDSMKVSMAGDSYEPSADIRLSAYDWINQSLVKHGWLKDGDYKKEFEINHKSPLKKGDPLDIEWRFCLHGVMRPDRREYDYFRTFVTSGSPLIRIDLNFPGQLRNPFLCGIKGKTYHPEKSLGIRVEKDGSYTYYAEMPSARKDGFIFGYDGLIVQEQAHRQVDFRRGRSIRLAKGEECIVRPIRKNEIRDVNVLEYEIERGNAASESVLMKRFEMFPDGFWVAQVDKYIVGYIESMIWNPWEFEKFSQIADFEIHHDLGGSHLYVIFVGVREDYRGEGIAFALLREILDVGKFYGAKAAHLVSKGGVEELYRKHGFEPEGTLVNFSPSGDAGTKMKKSPL